MDPRYQIFVSSTFLDLQEERQAVLDAILELAQFPAGMEVFPAADSTPWEVIEQVISESDYYVLIIGGKYGSVGETGISFTEREYDLAVRLHKPVLPFLHRNPDEIPAIKVERSGKTRRQLEAFRKKVQHHTCKFWQSAADLKSTVITSLVHSFRTNPQLGWIRAGGPDVTDILTRLADLQQRYDQLSRDYDGLRNQFGSPIAEDLARGDEVVQFEFKHSVGDPRKVSLTWNVLFYGIGESLLAETSDSAVKKAFAGVVASAIWATPQFDEITKYGKPSSVAYFADQITVADGSFTSAMLQFVALGLVETASVVRTFGDHKSTGSRVERVWKLTRAGLSSFLARRVVRKGSQAEA